MVFHVPTRLERFDLTTVGGVPTTGMDRTLIDCGALTGEVADEVLEDLVLEALQRGSTHYDRLRRAVRRNRGGRGVGRVRAVLRHYDPEHVERLLSRLEARFLSLFRRAGLPLPRVNRTFHADGVTFVAKLDFLWEEQGLVVEVDGLAFHSTRRQKMHDERRQNAIVLAGRRVLRYGAHDLEDPARVATEIRAALG